MSWVTGQELNFATDGKARLLLRERVKPNLVLHQKNFTDIIYRLDSYNDS